MVKIKKKLSFASLSHFPLMCLLPNIWSRFADVAHTAHDPLQFLC